MKKYIADSFAERMALGAQTLPAVYKGSFAVATVLLKTALFSSAARGERRCFAEYTDVPAPVGFRVQFKGMELRQDDLRVLLTLIKMNAKLPAADCITFCPRTFCRDVLRWADSSDSVAKLRASIIRMHDVRIQVEGGTQMWLCSLVGHAFFDSAPGSVWSVNLDKSVADMMRGQLTYLSVEDRLGMRDGLESWLYGYVKADACYAPIDRAELRERSGCTYEQKDFNKHLKCVLDGFVEAGIVEGWELEKGRLRIRKGVRV